MANDVFSVCAALLAALYTAYLLYMRIKRQSIMAKYKPGTANYETVSKLFTTPKLVISLLATLIFVPDAVVTVHNTKLPDAHTVILLSLLTLITILITFVILYYVILGGPKKR